MKTTGAVGRNARPRVLAAACTAGALVWGLATATAAQDVSRSFLSVPVPSRQQVGRRSWMAALVVPGLAHAEVDNPLPPPVVKDLERAAPKIQGGIDWFYFELLPAIKKEDPSLCRKALGSGAEGAYVSPLDSEITFPMNQLASANVEADEDGWTNDIRDFQKACIDMSDAVGGNKWPEAMSGFKKAKEALNGIMGKINVRAEGPAPFVLIDDAYEDRASAYLQKKKDMMAFRNQAGTLALR